MRVSEWRHRRRQTAVGVIAVTITVTLAGCSQNAAARGGSTSATRPARVILPVKRNPDGSIPWVNAPAKLADFQPSSAPPPAAVGPTCRARQVTAVLNRWLSKNVPGEPEDPVSRASLFGYVVLTNTSGASCTFSG